MTEHAPFRCTEVILIDQPTSSEEVHLREPYALQRQYHKHGTTKPLLLNLHQLDNVDIELKTTQSYRERHSLIATCHTSIKT